MGTHWSARYLGETGPQERHSRVRGVFITAPAGQNGTYGPFSHFYIFTVGFSDTILWFDLRQLNSFSRKLPAGQESKI